MDDIKNVQITVAEQIANFIASKNVPAVFQLSGGMIAFISDAIARLGQTKLINLKHEQSAGFAGEGITRISGIPSIVLATSGPGATNLVTPIASCFFDSTPVIFVTGQVNTNEIRKNKEQRQNGFQELEIVEVVRSIVKFSVRVESPEEVLTVFEKAWRISQDGRPGPVLIDIPIDLQQKLIFPISQPGNDVGLAHSEKINVALAELSQLISESRFPLILIGGGVRSANCSDLVQKFIEQSRIPAVYSLMGKDALPNDHELNFGFIGSYGNRASNQSLMQSDLLIVLGSRLDVRQTGSSIVDFTSGRRIYRVDIDDHELEGRLVAEYSYNFDLEFFMNSLLQMDLTYDSESFQVKHKERLAKFPPSLEQIQSHSLSPDLVMRSISEMETDSSVYVVDVGQHQMWAAQSIQLLKNQRFLTSGGLGAMGFSIPAAIGVAFATGERVAVIVGDGCAQLSLNELETIHFYQLPITIYVINNMQHGMVAQFQEENMASNFVGTRDGYSTPDFEKIAEAYGITSHTILTEADLESLKKTRKKHVTGPLLISVTINRDFKALPKIGGSVGMKDL